MVLGRFKLSAPVVGGSRPGKMLRCLVGLVLLLVGGIALLAWYALSSGLLRKAGNSRPFCLGTCSAGVLAGSLGGTSGLNAGPGNLNDGGPLLASELAVVC